MCTLAMAIPAAGMLVNGVMGMMTGNANAKQSQAEAQRIRQMGAVEEAALRRSQDYDLGQQQVDMAASGRSGSSGTALELAFRSKLEAEQEALLKRSGTIMQSDRAINEGRMAKAQGVQGMIGSVFSAAGSLLKSANEQAQMRALQ